jgi:hypothetical protein
LNAIDVVVVPDFRGAGARLFEARTLLFLGSWLEHEGASRAWPLHLACIGEPPASVRALAERAGARIPLFDELDPSARYLNKLRGLEVASGTGRILLLDADTVVLRDLSPALALGECFAALLAATNRIPLAQWEELYACAGAKTPPERERPLIAQLAERLPPGVMREPFHEAVPPHWNSGVILVPARSSLRAQWERAARLLASRFAGQDAVTRNDQPSLAVAGALLREEGVPYRPLPYALHGLDLFFAAGVLRFEDTCVYHAKTFFRRAKGQPLDPLREVELYWRHQFPRLYPETRLARAWRRMRGRPHPPAADSIAALCERLRELTARYVVPALSPPA